MLLMKCSAEQKWELKINISQTSFHNEKWQYHASWYFMRIQKSLHRYEAFLRLRFYYSYLKNIYIKEEFLPCKFPLLNWSSAITHYVHTYDGLGCHSWNYFLKKQSWSYFTLSLWISPHIVQDLNSDNSRRDEKVEDSLKICPNHI